MHVLARNGHLDDFAVTQLGEPLDGRIDELAGSGRPGCEADHVVPGDDVFGERALSVDQLGFGSGDARNFDETLRIRARLRADHEDESRLLGEPLDRILTVLRGVTDVIRAWTRERTEALLDSPRVPITSTWSAWPTSATRWPVSA